MYEDKLEIKSYENALRYPFNGNQDPYFTILELERDAQGKLQKFAANFEQHCEKSAIRADFGAIRFNSSLPVVSNPAVKLDGHRYCPFGKT
jgi:hypothetical protein